MITTTAARRVVSFLHVVGPVIVVMVVASRYVEPPAVAAVPRSPDLTPQIRS